MRTLTASLAALILLAVGFAAGAAQAQNLPSCTGTNTDTWNNCVGTHTFASGAKYVGGWRNGLMHGQGIYTWANGEKYFGEFRDDAPNGQGIYTWGNGNKYVLAESPNPRP